MKRIKDMISTVVQLLYKVYKLSPANIWFTIFSSMVSILKRISVIIIPAVLLNSIINKKEFSEVFGIVIGYTVIVTFADMSAKFFRLKLTAKGYGLSNKATLLIGKKGMRIDYAHWELSDSMNSAYKAVTSSWIFMGVCDTIFENLFTAFFSIIAVSYILLQANLFVWFFVLVLCIVCVWLERKCSIKIHEIDMEKSEEDKRNQYNKERLFDIKYGKEIRLYDAEEFFTKKLSESSEKILEFDTRKQRVKTRYLMKGKALAFLEGCVVYFFAIRQFAHGLISIGYFLAFQAAIIEFTSALINLIQVWNDLIEISDYFGDFKQFLELPEKDAVKGKELILPDDYEIRFVNVSFKYPGSEEFVLKNVNLTIGTAKKIALVGDNGCGKTTLIKLLLRLYKVTSGEILINGVNIEEYNFSSYVKAFASVFQDYQLHAFSVRENIAFLDTEHEQDVWELLEQNEMLQVIKNTSKGLETYVTKLLDDQGRDFSGGEKQKLAMARAQYKKSNILVLDEPTSAIDPLSECRYFERVRQICGNRTVIFVSHRMASTKFADCIYVLKDGTVAESGCYSELMEKDGIYAEMFKLQASYYKKEG